MSTVTITIEGRRQQLAIGAGRTRADDASIAAWGQSDLETLPWWPADAAGIVSYGFANLAARSQPLRLTRLTYPEWQATEAQWITLRDSLKPGQIHTFSRATPGGGAAAVRGVVLNVAMVGTGSGVPLRTVTIIELPTMALPEVYDTVAFDIDSTTAHIRASVRNPTLTGQTVHIRYREEGTAAWTNDSTTSDVESIVHQLTGLTRDTAYEVQVSLNADYSHPGPIAQFTTLAFATFDLNANNDDPTGVGLYRDWIIVTDENTSTYQYNIYTQAGEYVESYDPGFSSRPFGFVYDIEIIDDTIYFIHGNITRKRLSSATLNPDNGRYSNLTSIDDRLPNSTWIGIYQNIADTEYPVRPVFAVGITGDAAGNVTSTNGISVSEGQAASGPIIYIINSRVLFAEPTGLREEGLATNADRTLIFLADDASNQIRVFDRNGTEQTA